MAIRLAAELPLTTEGDAQIRLLADSLLKNSSEAHELDRLLDAAPQRLRRPLIAGAFDRLRAETLVEPGRWIARLEQLPATMRANGVESIARAWAGRKPAEAINWAVTLSADESRVAAISGIASTWAAQDSQGAAAWVATLPAGKERDRSAMSLVLVIAGEFPREAWAWAVSIDDPETRARATAHAARMMATRDSRTALEWIQTAPLAPESRTALLAAMESAHNETLLP